MRNRLPTGKPKNPPTRKLFVPLAAIEDGLALRPTFTTFDFVEGQDASRQRKSSKPVCPAPDFHYLWLLQANTQKKQKTSTMLYPIGIQNFEKIRQGGFLYVDKTNLIYQIVQTGGYYFLSRPRRFGKSLLVSTMEAYFQGKKELFKGLAIEQLEKEWNAWPVLHLDLSGVTYTDESVLNEKMESTLRLWEKAYDVANDFKSDSVRFYNIIDAAYEKTGKPVAILIDEYDKPLLDSVGNEPLLQRDEEPGRQTPLRLPHRGH